ncbi:amidase [Brucella melitensis]|uniref:amidase n=1 Tax=Brucella melitensis TaxID=29459 RepID=UPI001FFDCE2C|nr:amidase [Brucella melitensis]
MSHLADLSAVELVSSYKAKALSPVEVTEAVIGRIEAYEPKLNALWAYDPEAARLAAKASEARWAKGEPAGPIDGVPLTIKENIATKGTPVPLGCAALPLKPAAADAPPAARTREAGGVLLAKTTMPDLGMLSSGLSSFHKLARNPWDIATNPGGSSAGAGSAAAAGYGPLHIGTDIGGSVRLPAGWCGLVGLKPSFGRIPIDPPFLGRVAGPMTRTVADNALYMSVLSRPDRRDGMSLPYQDIDWMNLDIEVKGLKIGLWLDAGFDEPVGGGGNPGPRGSRNQPFCGSGGAHGAGGSVAQATHHCGAGAFLAAALLGGHQKVEAGKWEKEIAL